MEIPAESPLRLNIGCGNKKIEGFVGVDLDPAADVVCDIRALTFEDDSVSEILAVHVLEHIYRWEAEATLREWHRVLKPGALIVLELPDIVKVCSWILHGGNDRMGLWGAYGDPGYENPLMVHKWGWSVKELSGVLRACGFHSIKSMDPKYHKKKRDMRIEARK